MIASYKASSKYERYTLFYGNPVQYSVVGLCRSTFMEVNYRDYVDEGAITKSR